jgi:hypothetical protein
MLLHIISSLPYLNKKVRHQPMRWLLNCLASQSRGSPVQTPRTKGHGLAGILHDAKP